MGGAAAADIAAYGYDAGTVRQETFIPLDPDRAGPRAHQHFITARVLRADRRSHRKPSPDPVAAVSAKGDQEGRVDIHDPPAGATNQDQLSRSIKRGEKQGVESGGERVGRGRGI